MSARFWVNDPAIRFRRAVAMQTRAREHEGEIEMHRVANRIANFGVRTAALVIERAVRWVTA